MDLDLGEKRAVITGGSRGIGKSIAVVLASEGAEVAICGRNKDSLEQAAADILKETGKSILAVVADTTNTASVESFIGAAADHLGGIDILVNNAAAPGGLVMGPLNTANPDELLADIDTKVVGYMRVAKAAAPHLKEGGWGRIINITSTSASIGNKGQSNYSAAKSGIEAFSRSLAKEVGSRAITVNSIAPGYIETDMTEGIKPEIKKELLNQIPLSRFGKAEEVAELVEFLISEEASYITGQTIHINGGLYM